MAKRLRHRAKNINWTPEPIRPELLHSFHLPSIGSLAQRYKNFDHEPPSVPFHETIPSSSLDRNRMPIIRTLPPYLKIKNPSEMVLAYPRTRKLPAFNHADARSPLSAGVCNPSSAMAFGKGNNLKTPHGDIDSSGTEIGLPPPLSLSQKEGNRKQSGTLLFSVKIPKLAKRRRVYHDHARSKQIGWINTGGIIPWAMMAHTSLISKRSVLPQNISLNVKNIPYNNLRRKMRPSEAEPSMAPLDLVMGCGKSKFSVSLLSEEIEEDLMKIRGEMPLINLNKPPNETQSQLDNLFPGMCFINPENNLRCNSA